jgi:hypothetical protein
MEQKTAVAQTEITARGRIMKGKSLELEDKIAKLKSCLVLTAH